MEATVYKIIFLRIFISAIREPLLLKRVLGRDESDQKEIAQPHDEQVGSWTKKEFNAPEHGSNLNPG